MSFDLISQSSMLRAELAAPASLAARGAKAAREFEAHLIASMLEPLEKTWSTMPGESSTPGSDDYSYLATQALSQALASRGGFGLGGMIQRYLAAHEGKG